MFAILFFGLVPWRQWILSSLSVHLAVVSFLVAAFLITGLLVRSRMIEDDPMQIEIGFHDTDSDTADQALKEEGLTFKESEEDVPKKTDD